MGQGQTGKPAVQQDQGAADPERMQERGREDRSGGEPGQATNSSAPRALPAVPGPASRVTSVKPETSTTAFPIPTTTRAR
jgi:hypothetical protein